MADISNIFSVPKDYDEVIDKLAFINFCVLVATLYMLDAGTGIISSFLFSDFKSPEVIATGEKVLGDAWAPVMPAIAVSFFVALFFRIIRLHNFLSDLLGIRRRFDVKRIIVPLAKRVSSPISKRKMPAVEKNRHKIASSIFYKYASFNEPKIDSQLVSNARDNWYWFWVTLETSFIWFLLGLLVSVLSLSHENISYMAAGRNLLILFLATVPFLIFLWFKCVRSAQRQIEAILEDANNKMEVKNYLDAL